jgi:thioesterase domain-containing protein/acyl carrier protein
MSRTGVADYLAVLAAQDIKLWAEDGKLRVNAPQGLLTPELKQTLTERKSELLAFFEQQARTVRSGIPARDPSRPTPLTPGQARIWALAKFESGSSVYNVPTVFQFASVPDVGTLERALIEIERRHEALRTTFPGDDAGHAQQVIGSPRETILKVTDAGNELRGMPAEQMKRELTKLLQREVRRPFDLARGPLWRARLFRFGKGGGAILAMTMHHIVFDGISKAIFLDELSELYRAFAAGETPALPHLDVQFADYAAWQCERIDQAALERQLAYWKRRLQGDVAALATPNDRPRPSGKGRAGSVHFGIPLDLTRTMMELSANEQASPFIIMLTAFVTLMHRYTAQEDVVVCAPMASRDRSEIEKLIGYFNNIVVLRVDVSGNPSFRDLLGQVRRLAVEAYDNQYVPLQDLASLPNLVRTPLTRGMFSYQEVSSRRLQLGGIDSRPINVRKDAADFDLAFYTEYDGEKLDGVLDYNAGIYANETIKRVVQRFGQILGMGVENPDRRMSDFPAFGKKPANVETLLAQHKQIEQAVVVPLPRTGQTAAYLVLNEHDVPSLEDIRAFAATNLPDYKVPAAFIPVDEMPLAPDGTVDVAALPAPGAGRSRLSVEYAAPRSELEQRLATIWKKVLWLDFDVGIHDAFRDLGGHSLLSVQLVLEIEKELQRRVPAKALAELNTVADLAQALEAPDDDGGQNTATSAPGRLPADIYRGLRSHTASWQGKRTTPESVMVGLNTEGARQPLFWCLQRYQELTQLARYLGPDQPVYGMRSGNRVMVKSQENIDLLAAHYVDEILAERPHGPYLIGGNCQAALIAFSIARQLRERGHEITLLVLQEKFVPVPYEGAVALLFGEESVYNPLRYFREPEVGWHKYYSGPVAMTIVPGSHGQFFREPNVQGLTAAIRKHVEAAQRGVMADEPPRPAGPRLRVLPPDAYRARLEAVAQLALAPGERHVIPVQVRNGSGSTWEPSRASGIYLANRWLDPEGRPVRHKDGRASLERSIAPGEAATIELTITAPVEPGVHTLEIDLVDEGVAWFGEQGSSAHRARVEIERTAQSPSRTMEQA